jgi:hypothetical protein
LLPGEVDGECGIGVTVMGSAQHNLSTRSIRLEPSTSQLRVLEFGLVGGLVGLAGWLVGWLVGWLGGLVSWLAGAGVLASF